MLTEKQFEERKKALAICEDYSPQKTYWVGQEIRHTTFQDTGTVLKKTKSDGGHKLVVVKFEKSGKKTLIEGIEA